MPSAGALAWAANLDTRIGTESNAIIRQSDGMLVSMILPAV